MADQLADIRAQASDSLMQLMTFTSPHLAQIQELQAAGVNLHRIESLYPFDIAEHAEGMVALLNDDARYTHLHAALARDSVAAIFSLLDTTTRLRIDEEIFRFMSQPVLDSLQKRVRADSATKPSEIVANWCRLLALFDALAHSPSLRDPNSRDYFQQVLRRHRATANALGAHFAEYPLPGAFEDLPLNLVLGRQR